jgi:leucyl aminopeptidase (aminopeptidase T)
VRRELHFHWADGTRAPDGLRVPHPPEFDALYADALDIDYEALDAAQERAIALLRLGTVRINTPAGTDLMFRIGKRPFNKQNGDASGERAKSAHVRVDRHIELPAGALRVAPVEGSVFGQIVLPEARFGDTVAKKVAIRVDNGRISSIRAEAGLEAVQAAFAAGGDAAQQFREFALGFNPKLTVPPGSGLVPYYGYGSGVVRVSFGDNEELGGDVRGGFVRWLFLPDATLNVDFRYMLRDGKLTLP